MIDFLFLSSLHQLDQKEGGISNFFFQSTSEWTLVNLIRTSKYQRKDKDWKTCDRI